MGRVRAGAGGAGRAARGPAPVVGRGDGVRPAAARHTAVRGPVAGRAPGRRPVPRAAVLRPPGRDRAVPGHRERGQVAPVVRRRAVPQRHAHRVARAAGRCRGRRARRAVRRGPRGRLRDRVRPAHRADGQERRSHGAVRPAGVGARPHTAVHVRQTVSVTPPPPPSSTGLRFEAARVTVTIVYF